MTATDDLRDALRDEIRQGVRAIDTAVRCKSVQVPAGDLAELLSLIAKESVPTAVLSSAARVARVPTITKEIR